MFTNDYLTPNWSDISEYQKKIIITWTASSPTAPKAPPKNSCIQFLNLCGIFENTIPILNLFTVVFLSEKEISLLVEDYFTPSNI